MAVNKFWSYFGATCVTQELRRVVMHTVTPAPDTTRISRRAIARKTRSAGIDELLEEVHQGRFPLETSLAKEWT